jgi:hypothetical protein
VVQNTISERFFVKKNLQLWNWVQNTISENPPFFKKNLELWNVVQGMAGEVVVLEKREEILKRSVPRYIYSRKPLYTDF